MQFLENKKRYPALVAGIGTGKTLFALLKVWKYCLDNPNSLALIVRKEFTDLRDSTIKDFYRYFNVNVDSNKEYYFQNKSCIMFRHGAEMAVLKNLNLSIFMIEQAEEFDSDEAFTFLRDRLRRDNAEYRQGIIIANTNGHNWVWRLWKNNPQQEFELIEANTFDNKNNLPEDFIEDLKRMETEAPHHYARYVMNSWEETDNGDLLIPYQLITDSFTLNLQADGAKILAVDVARFGEDETVFSIIQKANAGWKQIYLDSIQGQDTMHTVGRIADLKHDYGLQFIVIDDTGLGGGVVDRLNQLEIPGIYRFIASGQPTIVENYYNKRAECYWKLKELFSHKQIQIINNDKLTSQLSSMKFKYRTGNQKIIESKDDMKKRGLKSPDHADALMMSMFVLDQASALDPESFDNKVNVYRPQTFRYRPMSYGRRLAHAR